MCIEYITKMTCLSVVGGKFLFEQRAHYAAQYPTECRHYPQSSSPPRGETGLFPEQFRT